MRNTPPTIFNISERKMLKSVADRCHRGFSAAAGHRKSRTVILSGFLRLLYSSVSFYQIVPSGV
jgi:hypothetical protein